MTATERLYRLDPIDWWDGWTSEYDYLRGLFISEFADNDRAEVANYISVRAKAERMALKAGWEGDIRGQVFVSALPPGDGGACSVMIAWKQDNNGETFVYSPWPLPWLENAENNINRRIRVA